MSINTIKDLIAYLESGNAYAEAIRLDMDELLLLKELLNGLTKVVGNEAFLRPASTLFRRKVQERQP